LLIYQLLLEIAGQLRRKIHDSENATLDRIKNEMGIFGEIPIVNPAALYSTKMGSMSYIFFVLQSI